MMEVFKTPRQGILVTNSNSYKYVHLFNLDTSKKILIPILNFSINLTPDINIHKSLANNLVVSSFGDKPVAITIKGIVSVDDLPNCKNSCSIDILSRFLLLNKDKPISIYMAGSLYKGLLISLQLSNYNLKYPTIIAYSMRIIGKLYSRYTT